LFQGLLAEIEAEGQGVEGALTRIDEALALAGETGEHWADALLHRIRGEILLKRDPAHTEPAEEAFLAAIAIAQQQKARSFELRAAMSMARPFHCVFSASPRGQMGTLKNYQRYAARCLEQARADPDSKHRLFLIEMAEAWRRLAEKANASDGYTETPISEPDRGD
jgi:hypothetical protein